MSQGSAKGGPKHGHKRSQKNALQGDILGKDVRLTLEELCRCCGVPREQVLLLIEEGIIEPEQASKTGRQPEAHENWHFHWRSLTRVRASRRLQRDLGVNVAGVALVLELMERIEKLENQLIAISRFDS